MGLALSISPFPLGQFHCCVHFLHLNVLIMAKRESFPVEITTDIFIRMSSCKQEFNSIALDGE